MGNCVSCTEPSSHEQPERWPIDGDKKLTGNYKKGKKEEEMLRNYFMEICMLNYIF